MNKRLVLKQFGSLSVARIVAALLQGASLILIARAVQPTDFGLLALVLGLALVAQTLFDLGLTTFILHERSTRPESGRVTAALHLNNRMSLALCFVALVVMVSLGLTWQPELLLLTPLAVWMSAERNGEAWLSVAFADGDSRVNFISLIARRVLALIGFIALQETELAPLLSFALAWAIPSLLTASVVKALVGQSLPPAAPGSIRGLVAETWPFWLHSLTAQANNLDVALAALVGGANQAGVFATATRLISPLRIVPTSMAKAILPAASRASTRGSRRLLLRYCLAMVGGMSFVYGVLFLLTPTFLPLILGDQYRPAIPVLQIVLVGLPLAAAASLFGSLLQGAGEKRFVANTSLAATASYLAFIGVAMNTMGPRGAAIALCGSYLLQVCALVYWSVRVHWLRKSPYEQDRHLQPGATEA